MFQDAYRYTTRGVLGAVLQLMLSPGLQVCVAYRVANWLHRRRLRLAAQIVCRIGRQCSGAEIHPMATIGRGLCLPHPHGVVVGIGVRIGSECTLYDGVNLGVAHPDRPGEGYPALGERVLVGTGAKVLGGIEIGDGARIGANAVVLQSVPAGCVAAGVPARIVGEGLGTG